MMQSLVFTPSVRSAMEAKALSIIKCQIFNTAIFVDSQHWFVEPVLLLYAFPSYISKSANNPVYNGISLSLYIAFILIRFIVLNMFYYLNHYFEICFYDSSKWLLEKMLKYFTFPKKIY